jgi:SAM-dependent methyltransferase
MPRVESYGERGLTLVDRLGVWLSTRAIKRHLPRGELDVLELGCGYCATHLIALEDRVSHGVGVDVKIAPKLKNAERYTFYEGAIEEILPQLENSTTDVVLLISVLEHLADPLATLRSVHRILKTSGVLLINVPTWIGKTFLELSAFRFGLSPQLEIDDHKMYYNKRSLWPLLVRAGFKPSQIKLNYHKFGLNLFARVTK